MRQTDLVCVLVYIFTAANARSLSRTVYNYNYNNTYNNVILKFNSLVLPSSQGYISQYTVHSTGIYGLIADEIKEGIMSIIIL